MTREAYTIFILIAVAVLVTALITGRTVSHDPQQPAPRIEERDSQPPQVSTQGMPLVRTLLLGCRVLLLIVAVLAGFTTAASFISHTTVSPIPIVGALLMLGMLLMLEHRLPKDHPVPVQHSSQEQGAIDDATQRALAEDEERRELAERTLLLWK